MTSSFQTTIREEITLHGVGVHSGDPVRVTLHPADADSGIAFYRSCAATGLEVEIPANRRNVVSTVNSTNLGADGLTVGTVEHLVSAAAGLGVDNLLVEIDGAEVPIMDGSAAPFVEAMQKAGIRRLNARRRFIQVLKPVRIALGQSVAELTPYDGQRIEAEIAFDNTMIGRQRYVFDGARQDFARDVARARTFGFMKDVETMWSRGLALGASLDNTVVVGDDEIVNPEGLRYRDEFARHKVLDAMGDLRLAGAPILGSFRSVRGGHKLNAAVVNALMDDPSAWTYVHAWPEARRTEGAQAQFGDLLPSPAYGPEIS